MLLFKQKFHDAIRRGEKTQTLRSWKSQRVKAGQKDMIPGVGPIMIDSVEEVLLDELTDADAIPDGFPTAEALKNELRDIYGDGAAHLYKVRFHLLKENGNVSADPGPVTSGKSSASPKASKPASGGTSRQAVPDPIPRDLLVPHSKEPPAVVTFVLEMKREFAERMKKYMNKLEAEQYAKNHPDDEQTRPLSEAEVVELMVRRCRINRNVCDWNHEPCKSQDFFNIFQRSPRDERGVPTLDGYRLRSLMRDFCDGDEDLWESINWIACEICSAWTEWQYAVEHWVDQPASGK